jgi:hypothetical protein
MDPAAMLGVGAPPPEAASPPPADDSAALAMMQMMNDVMALMETEQEEKLKPKPPAWWKKTHYPRPDPSEQLVVARRLWNDYSDLRERFRTDLEKIRMAKGTESVFKDFNMKWEKEYADPSMAAEVALSISVCAGMDINYEALWRDPSELDEAGDKEDFLYAFDEDAARQHALRGHGSYKYDLWKSVHEYGRIIERITIDFEADEGEMPYHINLMDPATMAMEFDDRGMCEAVNVYRAKWGRVRKDLDYDGNISAKVKGRDGQPLQDRQDVEVIDWWNRRWRIVWVNSQVVIGPAEHDYYRPPFTFKLSNLGAPSWSRDPETGRIMLADGTTLNTYSDGTGADWSDSSLVHKGVSAIHLMRHPHEIREAVASRMVSMLLNAANPKYAVSQSPLAYKKGVPSVEEAPGSVIPLMAGEEELNEIPNTMKADALGPLSQILGDSFGRTTHPMTAYGMAPNSQSSGYAIGQHNDAGRHIDLPFIMAMQDYLIQRGEYILRCFGNHGQTMKQGDGERGVIYARRSDPLPGQAPLFQLDPGDVRRTGYQIRVDFHDVRLQELGPLANALGLLMDKGLMNRRTALKKYLKVRNVDKVMKDIDADQIRMDPVVREAEILEEMFKNGEQGKAAFIAMRKQQELMASRGGGMGGMAQGGAGAASPVGIQGESLPGYDMAPGIGSGPQAPYAGGEEPTIVIPPGVPPQNQGLGGY